MLAQAQKETSDARDDHSYYLDLVVGGFLRMGQKRTFKKRGKIGWRQSHPHFAGHSCYPASC